MISPTSTFVPPRLSAYRGRVGRRKYSDAKWRKVDVTTHVRGPPNDTFGNRPPSDGGRSARPAGLFTFKMAHFMAWAPRRTRVGRSTTWGTPIDLRLPRGKRAPSPRAR